MVAISPKCFNWSSLNNMPLHKIRVIRAASAFALLLLLGSLSNAFALGLGSLQVDSFLNEPFSGKIEFVAADGEELSTVRADIAGKESFERLGVEYPDYIEDLKLSKSLENRKTFLLITSEMPIKEPFVHFIVEVEWSGGRFLREYTALIDPPVYAKSSPKALVEPKVVGQDSVYLADDSQVSESFANQDAIQKEELTPSDPVYQQVDEEAVIAEQVEPQESLVETGDAGFGKPDSDAKYGPVSAGESLSIIAQGLQSEFPDLSIYQIMQVLFEENRDSFIDDNINGLKRGTILNLSSIDKVRSLDLDNARGLFSEHLARWTPPAVESDGSGFGDSGISVAADTYQYSDDSLALDQPANDFSAPADDEKEDFRVGASSNFGSSTSANVGDDEGRVVALRSEISELEVSLQSSQLENQELKERISILEGQINDLNRLVSLDVEDADLAAVQSSLSNQLSELEQQVAQDASSLESADQGSSQLEGEFGASVAGLDDQAVESDTETALDPVQLDTASGELAETDLVGSFADAEGADVDVASGSESATEVVDDQEVNPAPAVSSFKKDEGFMSSIMSTIAGLGSKVAAGIGALVLLILGLIWYRRKQADEEFEVSMLSIDSYSYRSGEALESDVGSVEQLDDHPVNAITSTEKSEQIDLDTKSIQKLDLPSHNSEATEEQTKETSFLTVYSDSDAVVQADEVDPVAEADVYIAYGRFEQAEEVLKAGIDAEPERFDVKSKLMSMYQRTNKQDPFTRMAEDMFANRTSLTSEQWAEVCEMGKSLDPNNPLYETELDQSSMGSADVDAGINATADVPNEIDMSSLSADADKFIDDAGSIEFDAVDLSDPIDTSETALSDIIDDSIESDSSDLTIADVIDFDSTSIDLEDDAESLDLSDGVDLSALQNADNDSIEINLENSDLDIESVDIEASQSSFNETDSSNDSRNEFLQEVSDIEIEGDYDESKTQFELAKVFVDLGDKQGAMKILKDIIGNEANDSEIISDALTLFNELDS